MCMRMSQPVQALRGRDRSTCSEHRFSLRCSTLELPRFSRALRAAGQWGRAHRHWNLRDQHAVLSRKLQGHYAYYGITGNATALQRLRYEVERRWRKWLDRRSWRGRVTARGHPA